MAGVRERAVDRPGRVSWPSAAADIAFISVPIFEPVFAALNTAEIPYVVVGGVAVVLHGYPRLTADLDLALDLDSGYTAAALDALSGLGLKPLLPVPMADFADDAIRREWVRERNLKVFSLHDPGEPMRHVDLFAENPIPFGEMWERGVTVDLEGVRVRIAGISDLLTMKRMAGRPQDLVDVEALELIRRERERDDEP